MSQELNTEWNDDSEGPITTDEEQEQIQHEIDMKKLAKSMKLVHLHRNENKKRNHQKRYKSLIPELKEQTKNIITEVFYDPSLSKFLIFN
eukprot:117124_1